jgi:hypothetical protein
MLFCRRKQTKNTKQKKMKKTITKQAETLKNRIDAASKQSKETIKKLIESNSKQYDSALEASTKAYTPITYNL